jgi:hypothetical protein
LEIDIPKINDAIKTEGRDREENDQSVLKSLTSEINKLSANLSYEKKMKEDTE